MVILERYKKNKVDEEWDQKKLERTKINLIGSGTLSDLILADFLSLGIGNITRTGASDFFDFESINPDVYLEQRDESLSSYQQAELCIGDADFIIDATNNMKSKILSSEIARNKRINYFSASSNILGFSISINKTGQNLLDFFKKYENHEQGKMYSLFSSAYITDELRKRIFPKKENTYLESFSFSDSQEKGIEKKIIQIGAGAIGTFSALALAMLGANLTIVDFDLVEETNLNRQFLFYNAIGLNKASVLSERLEKYSRKIVPINEKVGEDFNPEGYDFIFICVDNNQARYYINQAAKKYNLPVINGGSSLFAGQAMPYFPGKTSCLDCQTGFKLRDSLNETKEKRRPGECFNPSLIISNQVVAGLMINCFNKSLQGIYEKSNYLSGQGIYNQKVNSDCFAECVIGEIR